MGLSDNAASTGDNVDDTVTLVDLLQELAAQGYAHQLIAVADGELTCTGCESQFPSNQTDVAGSRCFAREADPDESKVVMWGTCPNCGEHGIAVFGTGAANNADLTVLRLLQQHRDDNDTSN